MKVPPRFLISSQRIELLIKGLLLGVFFYLVMAVISGQFLGILHRWDESCRAEIRPFTSKTSCVSLGIYYLLNSISWGPGMILIPLLSVISAQIVSSLCFGVVAGVLYMLAGWKLGTLAFFGIYIVIVTLLTLFGYLLALAI